MIILQVEQANINQPTNTNLPITNLHGHWDTWYHTISGKVHVYMIVEGCLVYVCNQLYTLYSHTKTL